WLARYLLLMGRAQYRHGLAAQPAADSASAAARAFADYGRRATCTTLGDANPRLRLRSNGVCERSDGGTFAASARNGRRERGHGGYRFGPGRPGAGRGAFVRVRRPARYASAHLGAALGYPASARRGSARAARDWRVFAVLHGAGNGLLTIARGTVPLAVF